ncbi:MAG: 16S rRNA (guanine(966)-N(2))-methyltransferase RsmD [Spirochaetales bacterium]|nr:16S rRNA (guanine(966)-N(2))-methyltransferase RsmD [Spirochaetales bacterium]
MRITGGIYKGRTIKCPKGEIRPAMDRMRESLFSILGSLNGYSFLDLFAGSAVMSVEAASRGSRDIECVEMDRQKKKTIYENLTICETGIKVWMMTAEQFIKRCPRAFDIIYLDPPFALPAKQKLIELISRRNLLEQEGRCIIHHPAEERWPETLGNYVLSDTRKYGRSILHFYTNPVIPAENSPFNYGLL